MSRSVKKYILVGVLGTFTHLTLLYLFVEFFQVSPLPASSIAFVWLVLQSYWLNRNWTFQSDRKHTSSLPRYIVVSMVGFLSNLAIMYLMLNVGGLWYMAAQTVTIVVIPLINYLFHRYWTFS